MTFAGIDARKARQQIETEGKRSPNAKLCDDDVREIIRQVVSENEPQAAVAKRFNVSASTVSNLLRGECYADVHEPLRQRWPEIRRRRWAENGRSYSGSR